ncbi:MAG: flagellin FliC [Deltaproteobacteria bacterium]|nr:flagellin FliC [Deltaproteobacteria bacterium]
MTLRIRTNVMSLIAQRHFSDSSSRVQKHMERLGSGRRINKAADDAAGLAISEIIRSDLRSLAQSRRNTNDGISLIQVAEGGLNEVGNIMVRLKELAVQAASDTISNRERQYLNLEFMQLKDEVDRISLSTEFNGTRLLTGSAEDLPEPIKAQHQAPPFEIQVDKDYHPETDSLSKDNPVNIIRLDFRKINAMVEGEGSLKLGRPSDEEGTRVDNKPSAQQSMRILDEAVNKVASYRAILGAYQNRLESADRNLGIRMENLSAARSRIADADFANETAEYTQGSILQQAGSSILSQANQLPKIALQLLQGN